MKTVCITLGLLLVCGVCHISAAERGPDSQLENAALSYWQAFAMLPELNDAEDEIVRKWDTVVLDDQAKKLINTSENALALLHRGAGIERCYWGSALEEGPGTLLPHLSKARMLARFACLRARYRFQEGRPVEAWQDVKDTLILSRHVGSEALLISFLVQIAMERRAISALASDLPNYPKAELKNMLAELKSLPPSATVRQGIEGERRWMLGWIRGKAIDVAGKSRDERIRFLKPLLGIDSDANKDADALLQDVDAVRKMLNELDGYYDEMAGLEELPEAERNSAWKEMERRIQEGDNPWARLLLPAIGSVFSSAQEATVQMAMLQAGVDIVRAGSSRLEHHQDPVGDGPFQIKKFPGGFELTSQMVYRDKPVTLTVGRAE